MMKGCLIAGIAAVVVVLAFGGCAVGKYNTIVTNEEKASAALVEIDNQYQRRYDLVPQLVEVVKGASDFEKSTITAVTDARASVGQVKLPADAASNPEELKKYFEAQQAFGSSLSRLMVVAENYPVLRATEAYRDLQSQLEGTENRLAVARRDYIDAVRNYNVSIKRFPGNLIAGAVGYEKMPQLEFEDQGQKERPTINFKDEE